MVKGENKSGKLYNQLIQHQIPLQIRPVHLSRLKDPHSTESHLSLNNLLNQTICESDEKTVSDPSYSSIGEHQQFAYQSSSRQDSVFFPCTMMSGTSALPQHHHHQHYSLNQVGSPLVHPYYPFPHLTPLPLSESYEPQEARGSANLSRYYPSPRSLGLEPNSSKDNHPITKLPSIVNSEIDFGSYSFISPNSEYSKFRDEYSNSASSVYSDSITGSSLSPSDHQQHDGFTHQVHFIPPEFRSRVVTEFALTTNHPGSSCLSCIKGHRAPSCDHSHRPLFKIRRRGRPQNEFNQIKRASLAHEKSKSDSNFHQNNNSNSAV